MSLSGVQLDTRAVSSGKRAAAGAASKSKKKEKSAHHSFRSDVTALSELLSKPSEGCKCSRSPGAAKGGEVENSRAVRRGAT